ncbi:MAG: flagellar export protein FliJ [Bermanella sp.]
MSKIRAQRMSPLIHLAKKSVNEALSYIGNLQQSINSENQKQQSLMSYQGEYLQQFQAAGSAGMSGNKLQQFESFILQIDTALTRQQHQVQQFEQQLQQAQNIYLQLNQRLKSYEKLQQKLHQRADAQENRQLQSFLDEMGAQLHRLQQDAQQ